MTKPIDYKFTMLVGSRLEGFTVKSSNPLKTQFRCPICGDSKTNKTKKRGWLNETPKGISFHCFNCGISLWLSQFLERVDPNLYTDYLMESKLEWMKDNNILPKEEPKPQPIVDTSSFKSLQKVSQLSPTHPAKVYVTSRKLPPEQHYRLYFAPKFNKFVNSIIPGKLNETYDEPRLVIPFFGMRGELMGFTGRSFKKDGLRYITIMVRDSLKVFGLDKVNLNEKFYVTEGALDSLFLPNAIASADASLSRVVPPSKKHNAVLVFDNEPRNKEIVAQMSKSVENGFTICIWPESIQDKDLNEMFLSGVDIRSVIDNNSFNGLEAKMRLAFWQKT